MESGRQAFITEADASAYLAARLSPFFRLIPEVRLQHFDGSRLRIDYVALPRGEFRVPLFGIEVKLNYPSYKDFSHALKQAIDYRHSVIIDPRSQLYRGQLLPFVFVWPDFRDLSESPLETAWVFGSERLAGKFNVGLIREQHDWQGTPFIGLHLSGSPFWRSHSGSVSGDQFGMATRKRGSA